MLCPVQLKRAERGGKGHENELPKEAGRGVGGGRSLRRTRPGWSGEERKAAAGERRGRMATGSARQLEAVRHCTLRNMFATYRYPPQFVDTGGAREVELQVKVAL